MCSGAWAPPQNATYDNLLVDFYLPCKDITCTAVSCCMEQLELSRAEHPARLPQLRINCCTIAHWFTIWWPYPKLNSSMCSWNSMQHNYNIGAVNRRAQSKGIICSIHCPYQALWSKGSSLFRHSWHCDSTGHLLRRWLEVDIWQLQYTVVYNWYLNVAPSYNNSIHLFQS